MKLFSLVFFILSFISCKNELYKKEPSLCQIDSRFLKLPDDLYRSISLELLGFEYNPESYFIILATSNWGGRYVLLTKCNKYTFKQIILSPNAPSIAPDIYFNRKSYARYFTSKEVSDLSDWPNLANQLHELIVNAPLDTFVEIGGKSAYEIEFYNGNERITTEFIDSIPFGILNFIDQIIGIESIWFNCQEVCEKYFNPSVN